MCLAICSCVCLFSSLHGRQLASLERSQATLSVKRIMHDDGMNVFVTQQVDQGLRFSFGIKHSEFMVPVREDPLADQ